MKIALTGTPGTGKSETAKALSEKGYEIIDLNKLVFERKWDLGFDEDYQSTIADLAKLNAHAAEHPDDSEFHFYEGHLAHLLDLDVAIVLRTHPDELKRRLGTHDFSEEKMRENLEAEALAVITTEAMERYDSIYEVETTKLSPEEVAETIERILKEPEYGKSHKPGKFDWLEVVF
jgi:adenylate kinase